MVYHILSGIPVLLGAHTRTSKSRTTLIACGYITNKV